MVGGGGCTQPPPLFASMRFYTLDDHDYDRDHEQKRLGHETEYNCPIKTTLTIKKKKRDIKLCGGDKN